MKNKRIEVWLFFIGIILFDIGLLFFNRPTLLLFLYIQLICGLYYFIVSMSAILEMGYIIRNKNIIDKKYL